MWLKVRFFFQCGLEILKFPSLCLTCHYLSCVNTKWYGKCKNILEGSIEESFVLIVSFLLLGWWVMHFSYLRQGEVCEWTKDPKKAKGNGEESVLLLASWMPVDCVQLNPYVLCVCETLFLIKHIGQYLSSLKINPSQSVRNSLINVRATCSLIHRFIKRTSLKAIRINAIGHLGRWTKGSSFSVIDLKYSKTRRPLKLYSVTQLD